MSTQRLAARICNKTALHEGFLKLYRYSFEVRKHGGGTHRIERELMERGHAVAVLAYDPFRDAVLLGNEFRPGALVSGDYPFRDQLIAGGLEDDESPLHAAIRETREEAGMELRNPQVIHPGLYVSSGGTSEKVTLVFGLVDSTGIDGAVHGADPSEDVLAVVLPAAVFIDRVNEGAIDDCKTLIAGYWFARHWPAIRESGYLPAGAPPGSLQR